MGAQVSEKNQNRLSMENLHKLSCISGLLVSDCKVIPEWSLYEVLIPIG